VPIHPPPIATTSPEALRAFVIARGDKAYRAGQVLEWVFHHPVDSFAAMQTLPPALRTGLEEAFTCRTVRVAASRAADDGETVKYLFRLHDGQTIETVAMHYPAAAAHQERTTLCLSSQVGCPIGCAFCATGLSGFDRNLEAAEIVDQVLAAAQLLAARRWRPTHLVFMGMGEPLNNYAAVLTAVRVLTRPDGLHLSPRRITISTIGLVPGLERLAGEGLPLGLAISLHAPNDMLRSRLIPVNRKYPLEVVLPAAQAYSRRTGRRVTYEYVVLAGVNDSAEQAAELARVLPRRLAHLNLIPMNPVQGAPFQPPAEARLGDFVRRLRAAGVLVTLRATRGLDIDAACGQLRAREPKPSPATASAARPPQSARPRPSGKAPSGAGRRAR
jgi:23S rRNA (adenine2503-C2)-methyltransferase